MMGFKMGAPAGYGFRRLLVDQNGVPKCQLSRGEWKHITTDRVLLIPRPPEEIAVVRSIYWSFVHERKTELQIARKLNQQGLLTDGGNPWTHQIITQILQHERYIGNLVWNKKSSKLDKARIAK